MNTQLISKKDLAILILSFNDRRITRAIKSVIKNDNNNVTKIYVLDGGSDEVVLDSIRSELRQDDVLISERDDGIFDALNKGMNIVAEKYFGWLGSDDYFPRCNNFFTNIINDFNNNVDAVILDCHIVDAKKNLIRVTKARDKKDILKGKHNGHFSTFLKKSSLNEIEFNTSFGTFSDILFFYDFFNRENISVATSNRIGCFQEVGGVSTNSLKYTLTSNFELFKVLSKKIGPIKATIFSYNKLLIKFNIGSLFIRPFTLFIKKLFVSPFPIIESFIRQFFIFKFKAPEVEINFINNMEGDSSLIALDIGAAEGYFSYNLATKYKHVHAFEPHPDHLRLLKPFRHKNIICHNIGLSNENNKSYLKIPLSKNSEIKHEASLRESNENFDEFKLIEVNCRTLDDYLKEKNIIEKIGFIKIDVEGFENEVINGARKTIERDMPIILCEIELRHNKDCLQIFNYLSTIGYKTFITKNGKDLLPFDIKDLNHVQSKERLEYRLENKYNFEGYEYINNFFFIK